MTVDGYVSTGNIFAHPQVVNNGQNARVNGERCPKGKKNFILGETRSTYE
jgi:hypothetical protein